MHTWQRRTAGGLVAAVGAAFIVTVIVGSLFSVGPAFEGMSDGFRPIMKPAPIGQLQSDLKGLSCPLPIVKTAMAIKGLQSGELLEALATDPGSVPDFAAWCRSTGNELVEQTTDDGVFRFVIRKR